MIEVDARNWVEQRFGEQATERISAFLDMVIAENQVQNLIAPGTIPTIWSRHVVDSAQLLAFAGEWQTWLDIGTGGGFPGMIVAILSPERSVMMVEPRRRRAEFLGHCMSALGLDKAQVIASKVEKIDFVADVISARAVASVDALISAAWQCAHTGTRWLLPRGQSGVEHTPFKVFHVEQSLTDDSSTILIGVGKRR